MKPTRKLCDTYKKSYKCFKKVSCNELGCFFEKFDSEWPDGGHLGGWPPMGLKPADAVLTTIAKGTAA
jgi:hypothetical protein